MRTSSFSVSFARGSSLHIAFHLSMLLRLSPFAGLVHELQCVALALLRGLVMLGA